MYSSNSVMLMGNTVETGVSEEGGELAQCIPAGGSLSIHSYGRAAGSNTFFSLFLLGEVKMMSFRETSLSKETR